MGRGPGRPGGVRGPGRVDPRQALHELAGQEEGVENVQKGEEAQEQPVPHRRAGRGRRLVGQVRAARRPGPAADQRPHRRLEEALHADPPRRRPPDRAADEAARAGLPPEAYLDHLQPIQRRGLLASRTGATTGYEDALERASQYRVAYARASAAQRPDWSKRGGPAPTRTAARRPAHSAAPPAPDATGPALADRPTDGRPAAAPGSRAPGPGAPAWDSPAARDAWAAGLIAAGIDPAAVRAARTGDQALHEPARRATRPARGSSTPPVKPPSPRTLTHRQRV